MNTCLLTEACVRHYSKSANLTALNNDLGLISWFKSYILSEEELADYNAVAEKLVSNISALENANEVYDDIYRSMVRACKYSVIYSNYKMGRLAFNNDLRVLKDKYLSNEKKLK